MNQAAPKYIFDASSKPSLLCVDVPLVEATNESVRRYGRLVDDPGQCQIEIVKWPAQGWRPVDDGTGNEGGVTEGVVSGEWEGVILRGTNRKSRHP